MEDDTEFVKSEKAEKWGLARLKKAESEDARGYRRSELLADADGSDWKNAEYTPNDKGGRSFRELKKRYNAKVKKGSRRDIELVKSEKGGEMETCNGK